MSFPFFPAQASSSAEQVDHLFFGLLALSGLVLLIVFAPMIFFLFKYRRGMRVNRRLRSSSAVRLEIIWTAVSLLLSTGLFAWGAKVYLDLERPPAGGLEIHVIGKQWMWKAQHAEGNREINELHVPAGQTVRLILATEDVIHSFYLPAFRIKQDAVPGRYTQEWFLAKKPGTYHLFCAEYCGAKHSQMIGRIVVMPPAEYENWLKNGQPAESLARGGERLFRELDCSGCHMGSTVVRSPRLEGIYGKPAPLANGQFQVANEQYLRDSILLPQAQIAAGYEPLMPTFKGRVSEEELVQLIAYIKSLGDQRAP